MPGKKTLTLGITVNLDNYENLRLEVAGEVESQEDADELAGFLDGMLARLGRGDEATAERVDAYRRRVFSTEKATEPEPPAPVKEQTVLVPIEVEEEEPEEVAPEPAPAPITPPTPAVAEPMVPEPAPAPETITPPAPAVAEPRASEPVPEKPAAPAPEPTPEKPTKPAAAPTPKPAPAAGEAVCEECGAPVTKTQKQMSQLFLSKTLCKGCMDKLTHPQ
ncbi:hypothetical protein E2N92_11085 [Methanofollis formosanus]|uniref:Uncharacterized protein n=1 Tax=Methanofollis formosanus TaxID=299308 RepID=A0A8G1A2E9_9EURY|nr:hypothetical protein [Methanofollis formosanus]QYZ79927.1 hypothetical protein E2N92_11085 [Methanofollis formosanus]